jgi:predicted regulator of amino acid metabolism with ACT domain
MSSHAVLFGIDYIHSDQPLQGCAKDVINMAQFLKTEMGYDRVRVYTEQTTPAKVTGRNIIAILWKLVKQSHTEALANVYIHFSGHGTRVRDTSGDEIQDGKDEAICPVDYATAGVILDDDLKRIFRHFNPITHVVCVLPFRNHG